MIINAGFDVNLVLGFRDTKVAGSDGTYGQIALIAPDASAYNGDLVLQNSFIPNGKGDWIRLANTGAWVFVSFRMHPRLIKAGSRLELKFSGEHIHASNAIRDMVVERSRAGDTIVDGNAIIFGTTVGGEVDSGGYTFGWKFRDTYPSLAGRPRPYRSRVSVLVDGKAIADGSILLT